MRSPNATFSAAVIVGKSEYAWNTIPVSRRLAGTSVTSRPSISTRPSVGRSNPASSRSAVVLPQPDGPSRASNSPGSSARSSPASACVAP